MKINIETYGSDKFKDIFEEYGSVLAVYGLTETPGGAAYIEVGTIEDLFDINERLKDFCEETDRPLPYFGLMVKTRGDGRPFLEIKDNYEAEVA